MRYSALRLIKESLTGHKGWGPQWRDPDPKDAYDYVIIGGGGHGLATAYYLAKEFQGARIAVLEKGWIGGGNVGRNTTIIRSNYLLDGAVENALNMPSMTAEEAKVMGPWVKLAGHLGSFIGQMTDEPIKAINILYDGVVADMNLAALNCAVVAGIMSRANPDGTRCRGWDRSPCQSCSSQHCTTPL